MYITKITFIRWIEAIVTDMRRGIYIYTHKKIKLHKDIKRSAL